MILCRMMDSQGFRIAVLGSNGGCGQPISLLLKMNPLVKSLALFDIKGSGVGVDLSHICTPARVSEYTGMEHIGQALSQSDIVVIPAGFPRAANNNTHGLDRDSLFDLNAPIVHTLAAEVANHCPSAMVLIITNPVNSMTPLFAEVMKQKGVHDPRRIFGLTALDVVRANTFLAESQGLDVLKTNVTVIGGHSRTTTLPLFSQLSYHTQISAEVIEELTQHVRSGGEEVTRATPHGESATLALAYATERFIGRLMRAVLGEQDVVECAFVENSLTESAYISTPLLLGPHGVEKVLPWGALSAGEQKELDELVPILASQVQKGVAYAVQDGHHHHQEGQK